MARMAEITGVAHNIAHHAASGLSYLSPHLAQALREVGSDTTEIELWVPEPYPNNAAKLQPLRLALMSLKTTAIAVFSKHGFNLDDIVSVVLHATPAPWDADGYVLHTRVVIKAMNDKAYDSGWLQ